MADRLVTAAAVARVLGVDPSTIRRWANAGRIPYHRAPGARVMRFDPDAVAEALIASTREEIHTS